LGRTGAIVPSRISLYVWSPAAFLFQAGKFQGFFHPIQIQTSYSLSVVHKSCWFKSKREKAKKYLLI